MELRTLLTLAAPYRKQLILLGLLTLISSLATLAIPWLAGKMISGILSPGTTDQYRLVALLLTLLAAIALLNVAVSWISGETSARMLAGLRMKIYEHVQALPISFHETHRQGNTLALMTNEVAQLSEFLTGTLANVPTLLLTVTGAAFLMFRIDPVLALLVPLLIPAFYLILKLIGRRLRGLARSLQRAEAEVVGIAEENLEMLPAIKAFAREDLESRRYQSQVNLAMNLVLQQSRIYAALQPLITLVAASAAVLLLFIAGRNVQSGGMTISELFSFLLYAALLTWPIGVLANLYGHIQTARGTMARLQKVLGQDVEPGYQASGRIDALRGEIEFRNVSFSYPGREEVLNDVNLHIRPGEVVSLTGANGAGKSTLMALLLRFYDPTGGAISLDGRDIADIDVRDLRRGIGVVPQRALLFNGTIRANIGFGLEGANDAEIETAARLAQAYQFIVQLADGFETEIGDHGVRLSGGERQRIALARALVKDPQVLIFDEATSMYDVDGENDLVDACREALQGRTIILITHRPASLALADRILCVEDSDVHEVTRGGLAIQKVAVGETQ
jgi:ATP-binding cassette subfamily B protein